MSLRTSAIHLIAVTTKTIRPAATKYQVIVSDTIATASPAALISGRMLGAGMWISSPTGGTVPLVVWLALGALAVRLFEFTPGQFALGMRVASVDDRLHVGLGRAAVRGVLIALVIPALFIDVDGRGIQDRLTGTALVRR